MKKVHALFAVVGLLCFVLFTLGMNSVLVKDKNITSTKHEGLTSTPDEVVLPLPLTPLPPKQQQRISVSVVIPVYNSEKYLSRCIGTLQNQTLQSIEFIFVDDCSTDNSSAIIEKHAHTDPRIRLIHNANNSGPGVTRNVGIKEAQGQYVGFLDPDDYLSPTFYETLYNAANGMEEKSYDIAKGQLANVREDNIQYHPMKEISAKNRVYSYFFAQHYTAIFKRDLLNLHPDARYGNTSLGEDLVFLAKICFYAKNITLTNKAMYFYDTHKYSLASTNGYKSLLDLHASHREMLEFYKNNGDRTFFKDRLVWIKTLVNNCIVKYKRFEESSKPEEKALYEEVKAFKEYIDTL